MNESSKSYNNIIKENIQTNIDLNINNKEDKLEKTNDFIEKMDTKKYIEKRHNFCTFMLYKITCGKKYNYYDIYRDFRTKIISEEHLIKNHLKIYNLLKVTERKRNKKRNSFQLNNLMKMI